MKRKFLLTFALFLSAIAVSSAQCTEEYKWGDDPQRAKEKFTLFSDDLRSKSYKTAVEPLEWLLENTPDLNCQLYIKGVRTYHSLVQETEDATQKSAYEDAALKLYDQRIKNFGGEADVLNQKGYYAVSYWIDRPEKLPELYDLYARLVELNKNDTYSANIKYNMYVTGIMFDNKLKGIDTTTFIDKYEHLTSIIEHNIGGAKDQAKLEWEETQEYIDAEFVKRIPIDCDFIRNKMIPELEVVPDEDRISMLNDIIGRMLKAKCLDDPNFIKLSEELVNLDPSWSRYQFLIKYYLGIKDYATAESYIAKALPLAETQKDKAEALMTRARLKSKKGDVIGARADARQAISTDASLAYEGYTIIGDLYFNSARQCNGGDASNPVNKKAIYIAAYNKYVQAGNQQKAALAKQYFPTKTEIFERSAGGTIVNVGCWVGETVTIPSL